MRCPQCGETSGDDWSQCPPNACPMGGPQYNAAAERHHLGLSEQPSLELFRVKTKSESKVLYFRCRYTRYKGSDGSMIEQVRFVPLKRKSTGELSWVLDDFTEDPDIVNFPKNPVNGGLYRAHCTITGRDFETGWADEWEWNLIEEPQEKE